MNCPTVAVRDGVRRPFRGQRGCRRGALVLVAGSGGSLGRVVAVAGGLGGVADPERVSGEFAGVQLVVAGSLLTNSVTVRAEGVSIRGAVSGRGDAPHRTLDNSYYV